jgi:HlyD family secretion protein
MILNEIKKILYGVNRKNKSSFIILVILLLFNSILEIVSISSIMPFMQSITDLDQLLEKPFFIKLLSIVEDRDSYPGFLGALSLSLIFLSSVVAIISNKMLLEFGNFVGRDMCQDLFKSYLYSPYKFHLNNT